MRKKRILIANDAHYLGTGYGVYGKELLTRLHNTGKYEIAELACYATTDMIDRWENCPWKVYPNAVAQRKTEEQPELKEYSSNPVYHFGSWRFEAVCCHFKPDIVFDMRDYWMYAFQEVTPLRPFFKWVVMPTVDSAPQKAEWTHTFQNMDLIIPYTEWAKNTLEKQCGSTINLFPDIANAGVDLNTFVPPSNKNLAKKEFFGSENLSITGCVMRNQKRKLFPNIFIAYRKYLDRLLAENKQELYDQSFLYCHTSYPESSVSWDMPGLLLEHKLYDKVLFTSVCKSCNKVIPTKFHEKAEPCLSCKQKAIVHTNAQIVIDTKELVKIYQTFDIFLQIAICEGFGMPQVEAAACGVPIASLDYSAMTEIVRKLEGYPVPVKTLFREIETGADRAYPDNEAIADIIYKHILLSDIAKNNTSVNTRMLCEKYYSWDQVADVWDRALDSVDISTNLSWDSPMRKIRTDLAVPKNLTPVEVVQFIVLNIIDEPILWKTAPIQKLLRDLTNGYGIGGRTAEAVDMKRVVEQLEKMMQKKVNVEKLRENIETFSFSKGFLNV